MTSRELLTLRDHARRMAEDCILPSEAELWTQIADEIDAYLHVPTIGQEALL